MKKTILAVILVLLAALCFAQEGETVAKTANAETTDSKKGVAEKFNMEVSVGISVHSINNPNPHSFGGLESVLEKVVTANTTLGFGMTFPIGKFVGLTLDADFFFGNEKVDQSAPYSSSISLFGTNVLVAPIFYLLSYHDTIRIPMAVGVHMFYWDSDVWLPTLNVIADETSGTGTGWLKNSDLQLGLGMYVGLHFYFTPKAYMISRVNISVDFLRWHKMQLSNGEKVTREEDDKGIMSFGWGIKPTIGLGMRF